MPSSAILKRMVVALGATLVSAPACAQLVGPLDTNGRGGSTGTGASTGTGSCPLPGAEAGCPPVRTLYSDSMQPTLTGVVLVGRDLYFGTGTRHTVMRVGSDGSGVEQLADAGGNTSLVATDGTSYVFWADDTAPWIQRMGLDGTDQFPIAYWSTLNSDGAHPTAMMVTGGYAYWAMKSPASVFRAPTDGSLQQNFWETGTIAGDQSAISPAMIPLSVAVDDQNVYWSDGERILRVGLTSIGSPDAGAPDASVNDGKYPFLIAVDQDRLYWTETLGDVVQSQLKNDGSGLLLYGTGQAPVALHVDGTFVYWLNKDGSLWAAPKDASSPSTKIACASPEGTATSANEIASDDGAVYWTTSGRPGCAIAGGLFQVPKPAH
jgi:hypothetical protein